MFTDSENFDEEILVLKQVFLQNGYLQGEISQVLGKAKAKQKTENEDSEIKGVTILPYCSTIAGHLRHLLIRLKIKTVFHPPTKINCELGYFNLGLGFT